MSITLPIPSMSYRSMTTDDDEDDDVDAAVVVDGIVWRVACGMVRGVMKRTVSKCTLGR